MENSTILCFGFDRPMHLERMLKSLEENKESDFEGSFSSHYI